MIRLYHIITLFILSLIIISCSSSGGDYSPETNKTNIRINLVDSVQLKTPDDLPISSLRNLQRAPDGRYFLLDMRLNKLMAFSSEGEMIWETGQAGKGPGDLYQPLDLFYHDDMLIVSNQAGARADYYSTDGDYSHTRMYDGGAWYTTFVGVSTSDDLVTSSPDMQGWGHNITVYSTESDSLIKKAAFKVDQSDGLEIPFRMNGSISVNLIGNHLYSGSLTGYSYRVFNLKGEAVDTVALDRDVIVRPGMASSGDSRTMEMFGGVHAPVKINDELIMTAAKWPVNIDDPDAWAMDDLKDRTVPEPDFRYSLDFFSPDGQFLNSVQENSLTQKTGIPAFTDREGHIYTTSLQPVPTVYRYEVSY